MSAKERKLIECNKCGSKKFILLVEQEVVDCYSDGKDPVADHTINKENIYSLKCVKCGNRIIESFVKKPIPKKAWEEYWASYLIDYIMGFEHYAVNRELAEEDTYEAFLLGMAKGMWTIYNLIEALMVQGKQIKGRKERYSLTPLNEMRIARS